MRILLLGHSLIEFGDWGRLLPGQAVENLGRAGAHLCSGGCRAWAAALGEVLGA